MTPTREPCKGRHIGKEGDGRFVRSIYDVVADKPTDVKAEQAAPGTILVVDGLFLHRPELASFWDYSIFLDVAFNVSVPRLAARDSMSPDPAAESNRRYVEGQRIYIETCNPRRQAATVVDNNDLAQPKILNSLRYALFVCAEISPVLRDPKKHSVALVRVLSC